jgi:hypothetical protein
MRDRSLAMISPTSRLRRWCSKAGPVFFVPANIYRPKPLGSVKHAAILSPIGHFLGAGKAASQVQARCIGLAKLGFVVLTYDAVGQGDPAIASLPMQWNDPQLDAIVSTEAYDVDLASVIPAALRMADIYDLARLIAPRWLLISGAKDLQSSAIGRMLGQFKASAAFSDEAWLRYLPERPLDFKYLLLWLKQP